MDPLVTKDGTKEYRDTVVVGGALFAKVLALRGGYRPTAEQYLLACHAPPPGYEPFCPN